MSRFALIAFATLVFSAAAVRPASAASPWQLCLSTGGVGVNAAHVYLLNLVAQGNAILVSGTAGRDSNETHGPVVGTWSRTMGLIAPPVYELGLTVMISNAGDFNQSNTENVVFQFFSDGSIPFKRWFNADTRSLLKAMPICSRVRPRSVPH